MSILGATVPTIGGLHSAFTYAQDWGCDCAQFYTTLSRRWDTPALSDEEIRLFADAWHASSVREVISHVPFLVNIASADKELWDKSIARLKLEVARATLLNIKYLVLHPGSAKQAPKQEGMKRAIEALNIAAESSCESMPVILIETMAGQGSVLGSSFDEVAELMLGVEKQSRIGVCFDLAHVHAAGYPISERGGMERVIREFDEIIGAERIGVFHINDSLSAYDSHHDRHAAVGKGTIGLEAFRWLLKDARFSDVPMVLELPNDMECIKENLIFIRGFVCPE